MMNYGTCQSDEDEIMSMGIPQQCLTTLYACHRQLSLVRPCTRLLNVMSGINLVKNFVAHDDERP